MWTSENRGRYDRSKLRYPSDLTDEEWALVAPLIPAAKRGGNKRTVNLREVANGLMYILSTGCQWAAIPKDLPPRSTLHDYFDRWDDDGTLERIHHALYVACRELAGRDASPSAAIIDSQSVKSAEKGGAALTRRAMTAARRSGARSVMSWSRHPRPAAPGHRPCRGHSGPRGWRSAHGHPVRAVPVSAQAIRRRRISRAAVPGRLTPDHAPGRRGDCEAFGCRKGVHRPAEALDCRTHHRMAQPMPSTG